ncbi:uncharacterized protein LOC115622806 [Scaptodrosophila lebanonensis]|uniref:Uncharacterized protein LOC115622806 n=1 Tax=Drosophila lebanonensis TaxID=7225 RepID=A0A6J2T9N3_DROLE|nr:uncharacterized protein LOC115622806 [Scaptodrosophila lebanonensis]
MSDDDSSTSSQQRVRSYDGSQQQRIRNVLTLEERVAAIKQYDIIPMYSKIAKNFNCSWEQIKGIVANREPIMEFFEATRRSKQPLSAKGEELRKRKLNFLNRCLYEYIQRAQYYLHSEINEDLIRTKALEFRELMRIENFVPNKSWINHFKAEFNITLSNRQITITRKPPRSMDLRDIMSYCGRNTNSDHKAEETIEAPLHANIPGGLKSPESPPATSATTRSLYRAKTQVDISSANQATLEEVQQRRKRKISFLEKALYEYIQRSQFHHKGRLDLDNLRSVAISLRDILKIENFFPDRIWFNHFKSHYNFNFSQGVPVTTRRVPLSLDLRDIVSYCGRHEQRDQPLGNVTLTPKEANNRLVHIPFVEPKPECQVTVIEEDDDDCIAIESPTELIEIKDDEDEDHNHNHTPSKSVALKREQEKQSQCETPSKIKKLPNSFNEEDYLAPSPKNSCEKSEDAEFPRQVRSYADAIRLLRPIEDFALMEENYRAIGLLIQLEKMFESAAQKKASVP